MLGHVHRGHAERKGLELERLLPAEKRLPRERVYFLNLLVGHCVAAARGAVAMHHQIGAGVAPGAIIGIRKTGVEREIIIGIRIHLPGRDGVEALGRLPVAYLLLWTEIAGPFDDRMSIVD